MNNFSVPWGVEFVVISLRDHTFELNHRGAKVLYKVNYSQQEPKGACHLLGALNWADVQFIFVTKVENNDIFLGEWSLISNFYQSKVNCMRLIYFAHLAHRGENFTMIFARIAVFLKGFH